MEALSLTFEPRIGITPPLCFPMPIVVSDTRAFFRSWRFFAVLALAVGELPAQAPDGGGAAGGGGGGARGGRGGGAAASPDAALAGQLLSQGDKDGDQRLTSAELGTVLGAWFDRLDPEKTGRVRQDEFLLRFDSASNPTAAAGGGRGGRGGGGGTGGTPLAFFTASDLNRDAAITAGELKDGFQRRFAGWDGDKDGTLTLAELTAGLASVLPRNNMSGSTGIPMERIATIPPAPPSPILSAAESAATVQLEAGFRLELAAVEPMIEDPIAMSFDEDGRAYVLEMRGYMLDIDRTGERDPISRISRLEDTNGDGKFDKSTVFLDGLVLPRAIAATSGGIFYVNNATADHQLFFARDGDGDGKAEINVLVDAAYGRGNVEHAPNALFRGMDNWIYNGESPTRYRLINGTLVRQATEQRGQWGMTQDNYGRLLFNVNNSQLLGDFTPAGYMARNPNYPSTAGLNLFVSNDQRVWPARMNTAINRGYSPEVLDPRTGKAFVFASSCSPLVYRGDNFPAEYLGNVFVADEALNLIKRNLLSDKDLTLTAKFPYEDREFLAATDERFRPVNLYNGPDGTLWFVDLYHGIAQYGQFMTAYLRTETLSRGLDKGTHHGRIYRVVSTAKQPSALQHFADKSPAALVARLSDANGWVRDTAQRLLVESGNRSVAPALVQVVQSSNNPLARIHALWTLEGLFAELPADAATTGTLIKLYQADARFVAGPATLPADVLAACLRAVSDADPKVQVAALRVTESLTSRNPAGQRALIQAIAAMGPGTADETLFQAALTAGNLPKPDAVAPLAKLATQGAGAFMVREAVMTGLQASELQFLQALVADPQWTTSQPGRPALLQSLARAIVRENVPEKVEALRTLATNDRTAWRSQSLLAAIGPGTGAAARPAAVARALTPAETALVTSGATVYQTICIACHGNNGQGTVPLGPPLASSEWVTGSESRLIRIVLQGVSGPISVNGTTYQPPNIQPEMPGLAAGLNDEQIAGVLSYIRRSWGHTAEPVTPAQVAAVRSETRDLSRPWAPAALLEIR